MAKAALTLDEVRNYCVVDMELIPIERVKFNAVTCSDRCEKARKRQKMLLMEQTECKYCRRPSTPAERESFKAWREWVNDKAAAEKAEQSTAKITQEDTPVVTTSILGTSQDYNPKDTFTVGDFPYIYKGDVYGRKGQRCQKMPGGGTGKTEQIQFEDGATLVVPKMTVSGTKKKYSEKRGRPPQPKSTLAAKQQFDETNEGD